MTLPALRDHEIEGGGGDQAGVGHRQTPGRPLGRLGGGQGVQGLVYLVQGRQPRLLSAAAASTLLLRDFKPFLLRLWLGEAGQVPALSDWHTITDGVAIILIIVNIFRVSLTLIMLSLVIILFYMTSSFNISTEIICP